MDDISGGRDSARPWYWKGVRFDCRQCGSCCCWQPGVVWVDEEEIERISEYLNLPVNVFKRIYLNEVNGRFTIAENLRGECFMFDPDIRLCKIYEVRPVQCSSFPFWPEVFESPETWAEEGRRCPGMDEGPLWTFGQIRRRMRKD